MKAFVTLTVIVAVAAVTTWYFVGMPGLDMASETTPTAASDAAAPIETGSTAPPSPLAP